VQFEFTVDAPPLVWADQALVAVANRMQRPIEGSLPEIQEFAHFRKVGSEIVILPDIGLQDGFEIRDAIKYMRGVNPYPLSWRSRSDEKFMLHLPFVTVGMMAQVGTSINLSDTETFTLLLLYRVLSSRQDRVLIFLHRPLEIEKSENKSFARNAQRGFVPIRMRAIRSGGPVLRSRSTGRTC
jgi:hypothetical protein